MFQHTAARRRLPAKKILELLNQAFQHTAARRRLLSLFKSGDVDFYVSTHSRPKAAAKPLNGTIIYKEFQHTATRRWLQPKKGEIIKLSTVSTHSHPKVAASDCLTQCQKSFCFNTQPPEGGCMLCEICCMGFVVSTHSHPKVAATCKRCN